MSKRIKSGLIMMNDPASGALYPWLLRTLARLVIFPDGRTLVDHWQTDVMGQNKAKYMPEQTIRGTDTFNWEINVFGVNNVVMNLHTVMSIPLQENNNKYVFKITLPKKFIPDKTMISYEAATVIVSERESSVFMNKKCVHNTYAKIVHDELMEVVVDHFKDIDNVNLSVLPYITACFDISIYTSFVSNRVLLPGLPPGTPITPLPIIVNIPTVDSTRFVYDGTLKSLVIRKLDRNNVLVMDAAATEAGSYTATFELKPNNETSVQWSDGTTDVKTIKWSITESISLPPVVDTEKLYTGNIVNLIPGINSSKIIGTNAAETEPGSYTAVYNLANPEAMLWSDGTTASKSIEWKLIREVEPLIPVSTEILYDGTVKSFGVENFSNVDVQLAPHIDTITDDGSEIGLYACTVRLLDKDHYRWVDKTTEDKVYQFKIIEELEIPSSGTTRVLYDTLEHTIITLTSHQASRMTAENITATDIGTYTATFTLDDTTYTRWVDGTTTPKTFEWSIVKSQVELPSAISQYFAYDGTNKVLTLPGLDLTKVSVTNAEATDPGEYTAIFSLLNNTIDEWTDGTTADKTIDWSINRRQVAIPTLSDTEFIYDGTPKTVTHTTFDYGTSYGSFEGTEPGTYEITLELTDTTFNEWPDGSDGPQVLTWVIKRKQLDIPVITQTKFAYDGTDKFVYTIDDPESPIALSEFTASTIGLYNLVITITDTTRYEWSDGTDTDITIPWSIVETVDKPVIDVLTFEYDGTEKTVFDGTTLDTSKIAIMSNSVLNATSAGEYVVTFGLFDTTSMMWSDNTIEPVRITWNITKATPTMEYTNNISITDSSSPYAITITTNSTGTITAISSDPETIGASVEGNAVIVRGLENTTSSDKVGSTTITVVISADNNYDEIQNTITVDFNIPANASSAGSDAPLVEPETPSGDQTAENMN